MKEVQSYCGMCGRNFVCLLSMDELKELFMLPGAIRPDGRLSMACDECYRIYNSMSFFKEG